jgi:UDP-glucose 4-epimerase
MTAYGEAFKGKKVLVTGGLGFIGSNLSAQLVRLGSHVTIVDNMIPRLGGNLFNVEAIADKVHINFSDVRDSHSMDYLVKGQEFIFHLAGQVNHVDSIRDPIQDLDINCRGTLVLLESCRKYNRGVKIIFSGTRGVWSSVTLPVARTILPILRNLCSDQLSREDGHKSMMMSIRSPEFS